jgi:medium-chain acyl-[acyl-carrier-protein] hydrolase
MEPPVVWEQRFEVRAYEVDPRGHLATPTLCDWLQEAAGQHARALGWAIEELEESGLTWVLSRLHLRLQAWPMWGSVVRLLTWPVGAHRLYAVRDFRALDESGGEVALATSGWLLVRLASRRPVRPPAEIETMAQATPGRALVDDFARLPTAESGEPVAAFTARHSDLDVNHHVNNVALVRMVLDAVPASTLTSCVPAELEVEFRAEVSHGDTLEARVARSENTNRRYVHSLVRTSDGQEVVRARSRWAGKKE